MLYFLQCMVLVSLSNIKWLWLHPLKFRSSIFLPLVYVSIFVVVPYLFFLKKTIALKCVLKYGIIIPPVLFFFFSSQDCFSYWGIA